MLIIYPYKRFSESARLLAHMLDARIRMHPVLKKNRKIINWGNNNDIGLPMLNNPHAVHIASNKLSTFQTLDKQVSSVPWTTDKECAHEWQKLGRRVVVRSLLRASEGRGITIIGPEDVLPPARLYTQYIPKKKEFRVHVVGNEAIDIQEKRKRSSAESALVRSHNNDYVFCRENIDEPKDLRQLCITAIRELGLDFGAVDAIWNEKQNKCFVLEINTAPGLTETTAESYAKVFRKLK
jgi:glutathione synthase/RimK-type ligase-like ATP-grasp enzyme